ncbi:MAG TPA: hypothetical protein VF081_09650 [Solirubrobacterales bacterium]
MAAALIATALGLSLAVASAAAAPSLTVSASDALIGGTIDATAQLSDAPTASGEITFDVFGPGDPTCTGPALSPAPDPAPVDGEGEYESGEITPPSAGTYNWRVNYSGDFENAPAESNCLATSTVDKASPGLSGSASSGGVGTTITDNVTLSGGFSPGGQIVFRAYGPGDATCASTVAYEATVAVNGNDNYSPAGFAPGAGSYRWTVNYEGDANNQADSLGCGSLNQTSTVGKASPSLSGFATATVKVGTTITDSVTLSGGFSPGGQLVFRAFGPNDATCGSTAAYEATVAVNGNGIYAPAGFAPGPGVYRWRVNYEGDANNQTDSLSCGSTNQTSTVSKAAPTLAGVATAAAKVGATITDSATLSGGVSPGGQLVFRAFGPNDATCGDSAAYEATVAVSGNGTYAPAGFAPGPGVYRWTVNYEGDANNQADSLGCGSSDQVSTVSKASPTLSGVATAAAKVGTTITDSATLSGGVSAGGQLVFRAFGPGAPTCGGSPVYEKAVAVSGDGTYSPAGFAPAAPGAYHWTVAYAGDANNEGVGTNCGGANQTTTVGKASPTLGGVATSVVKVGLTITDNATLSGGFAAGGQLVFRAYGPDDKTCATTPAYEKAVAVSGDGTYAPPGFAPAPGLYRWTVAYAGDSNNEAVSTACDVDGQSSAVGTVAVALTATATGGTIGTAVTATATIKEGAIPGGQITFKAFPPADPNCAGGAAFSSTVNVAGNGPYRSAAFAPPRVGAYRWTVAYSGDLNHDPATVGCGKATSSISQAKPTIAGAVKQRVVVGAKFRDTATLLGGYTPGGSVTFRIYGPVASGCDKPAFVDTVAIIGNGTFNSDPFVALRPGRYSFVASYSGDTANQGTTEPCDSPAQVVVVQKRTPRVKPRAQLIDRRRISIRASLAGTVSPTGRITFSLYPPGDKRCKRKPAFSGAVTVKANGTFPLAQYIATKSGRYRLRVGYSGDERNKRFKGSCGGAQSIRIE